jgi:hypothetical protein
MFNVIDLNKLLNNNKKNEASMRRILQIQV